MLLIHKKKTFAFFPEIFYVLLSQSRIRVVARDASLIYPYPCPSVY